MYITGITLTFCTVNYLYIQTEVRSNIPFVVRGVYFCFLNKFAWGMRNCMGLLYALTRVHVLATFIPTKYSIECDTFIKH